jgi:hypothetical protein
MLAYQVISKSKKLMELRTVCWQLVAEFGSLAALASAPDAAGKRSAADEVAHAIATLVMLRQVRAGNCQLSSRNMYVCKNLRLRGGRVLVMLSVNTFQSQICKRKA